MYSTEVIPFDVSDVSDMSPRQRGGAAENMTFINNSHVVNSGAQTISNGSQIMSNGSQIMGNGSQILITQSNPKKEQSNVLS